LVLAHFAVMQPVVVTLQHFRRAVGRTTILNHILQARVFLAQYAFDGLREEMPLIERWRNDRDERRVLQMRYAIISRRNTQRARLAFGELQPAQLWNQTQEELRVVPQPNLQRNARPARRSRDRTLSRLKPLKRRAQVQNLL